MKDLRPIRGRYYIAELIAEGEHEQQDFKFSIPDARKIARTLSAFSNNAGGRLLVGVKDNGVIAGVRSDEDIYVLQQAAEMYCRPAVELRITPFSCEGGLVVIRAEVPAAQSRPVKAQEPDGRWRAYFRVKDENILAHPIMVNGWQRAKADGGWLFSCDERHRGLMEIIGDYGPIAIDEIYGKVKMPRAMVTDSLVALYASEIVEMRYVGGRFCVAMAAKGENT